MNDTDAIRSDSVRRLGRFVGVLWRDGLRDAAWAIGLYAGCFALFLAAVNVPALRPLLWALLAVLGLVAVAILLAALAALYGWLRRAWLRAGQTEPEYGVWDLRGVWWKCPRCGRMGSRYNGKCEGFPRWHVPVLRPEVKR